MSGAPIVQCVRCGWTGTNPHDARRPWTPCPRCGALWARDLEAVRAGWGAA